jgi:hypothetical protein
MADDRQPDPPRTVAAWLGWELHCKTIGREDWLPDPEIFRLTFRDGYNWPEDAPGISWIPLAEDHPHAGRRWCWRCLAQTRDVAPGPVPHDRTPGVICFQADRDADAEDRVEDSRAPEPVRIADPARPALASEAEHRPWWQAGASIVRDEAAAADEQPQPSPPVPGVRHEDGTPFRVRPVRQGYDTGTIFYDGPTATDRKREV